MALGRELASQLHPCLGELMGRYTWGELGAIAIGCGPGSFTGTRLGVVTARILAQQLEVPLLGLSSLGTMAWHYRDELIEQDGVVSRRAQQGHQYLGIYRYQGESQLSLGRSPAGRPRSRNAFGHLASPLQMPESP